MNQVEIKRKQIQFFSYCLAGINVWVFGKQLGNNGLAYLAAAFLVFLFFWILTGKNVPDRLGRLLRSRSVKGQYKNVSKMRRNMMIFQIAAGLTGAVLCATLGYFVLEKAFRIPYGSMILWILCPALVLRCMQSVLLGTFQSEGSEMPSAVSGILRQVFYFGLGLLFLGIFRTYGEKVSLLLKKDDFTAMYGAMGVALGIVISEVLVLIFVFVIYQGSASGRREAETGMKGTDTFFSQVRVLLFSMGGDIIGDLLLYLPLWTGLVLFEKNASDIYAAADSYGVFIGRYLDTMLLVVVLLCMGILPGVAKAGAHIRKKEERYAKNAIQSGIQGVFLHGMFFTIWLAVLAVPLAQTIDNSVGILLGEMFTTGSSVVLWALLLFYCSQIFKLSGKNHLALLGYGVMDLVFVITSTVLFRMENAGILSIVLGSVIGMAAGAVCLCVILCLQRKTQPDALRGLAIPAGCCCACGLLAFGLEKLLFPHVGAVVTVISELIITLLLYWFLLLLLRCLRGQDFQYIPGGRLMRMLGKMFRL